MRSGLEKEMTTGWQFATQIEDEEDGSKYEIVGGIRDKQNQSALLIANKDVFPSMLDPAFEDEDEASQKNSARSLAPIARKNLAEQKNMLNVARFTQGPHRKEPNMDSDYNCRWVQPSSLLGGQGRSSSQMSRAVGIKEFAWKGMPSDTDVGRLTHHLDKKFIEKDLKRQREMPSDNLPCGIQEVPKQLYVNSDMKTRRTSDV